MTKNEISRVIYVDHNQLCKAEKNSGVVLCLYKVEMNALITVVKFNHQLACQSPTCKGTFEWVYT